VERWREEVLLEHEHEEEKWVFSFDIAAEQQRLLGAVGDDIIETPSGQQYTLP
jgi:hypothetical protein